MARRPVGNFFQRVGAADQLDDLLPPRRSRRARAPRGRSRRCHCPASHARHRLRVQAERRGGRNRPRSRRRSLRRLRPRARRPRRCQRRSLPRARRRRPTPVVRPPRRALAPAASSVPRESSASTAASSASVSREGLGDGRCLGRPAFSFRMLLARGFADGRCSHHVGTHHLVAAAVTGRCVAVPARAAVDFVVGGALRAFFFVDQSLPVGDRDLVVIRMDFAERQEPVAIAAVIDEGRLQRRLDARHLRQIDIAS